MKKKAGLPKTQHSGIYKKDNFDSKNQYAAMDNPDDRMTEQTGRGVTLVSTDNPDDLEQQE